MKKYIAKEDPFLKEKIADESEHGLQYRYMLLSRMKADCKYYLGYGNCLPKYLWAQDEKEHISAMRMIYDSFSADQKPEWLTKEQLDYYERKMVV